MARKTVNVALIGQGFMGRAHSNAWTQVNRFFRPAATAVMHTACGRNRASLEDFAARWGWRNCSTNLRAVLRSDEIDLVDLCTPTAMHYAMVTDALAAGKNIACEKPLATKLDQARELVALARKAKAKTFVWYNYRRCPAVATAHQLVRAGRIGRIYHVRAVYLQDWAKPEIPLAWRFDRKLAGSGSHGDLNAHIIDMCRFVTGEEITEIAGAIAETFIKERAILTGDTTGGLSLGMKKGARKGKVTVDDAVLFLARFSGGAVASFEATRMATGYQNYHGFEIHGTKGAVRFKFERMNELEYYDATADRAVQGWTTIMCTHGGCHPYAEAWWPDAHVIGYEHAFTNQAYDILQVLGDKKPVVPLPNFADAYETQRVLEAAMISAAQKRPVKLAEVK
ncbi:MAG TPA: dehydrogenase [Phycisphaerales bacterium]|nr:dehydrogenase [Phycisphaerales bacterium]